MAGRLSSVENRQLQVSVLIYKQRLSLQPMFPPSLFHSRWMLRRFRYVQIFLKWDYQSDVDCKTQLVGPASTLKYV